MKITSFVRIKCLNFEKRLTLQWTESFFPLLLWVWFMSNTVGILNFFLSSVEITYVELCHQVVRSLIGKNSGILYLLYLSTTKSNQMQCKNKLTFIYYWARKSRICFKHNKTIMMIEKINKDKNFWLLLLLLLKYFRKLILTLATRGIRH